MTHRLSGVLAMLWLAGCTRELPPLQLEEGCQPLLSGSECLLPYPSDFFLVPDASLPSGSRVAVEGAARLETDSGVSATPGDWKPADGASRLAMPTAVLGTPITSAGVVGYFDDPTRSLAVDSRTLIIEASTGRFIPHFADLDPRAPSPERQALVLHPLVSLEARTRYVVVLQGLESPDGSKAAAPEGFRRLRDGEAAGDPVLERLSERYEASVFPVLEAAGVSRATLQLAWDFTTGSDELIEADLLRVRELTRAWLTSHATTVKVIEVIEAPRNDVWRTVRGTFEAPNFLEGDALHRGANGQVEQQGTSTVPFTAVVPKILDSAPGPAVALGYGHGSFGSRDEILSDNPIRIANESRAVLFATDWVGMARADAVKVLGAIGSEPSSALSFTERVPQGMANWMVLTEVVAGALRDEPAMQNETGEPLYPADASRFLGISQGHLLGGVLAAVHPGLTRVALSSGGAGFSHMLSRSRPLTTFFVVLDIADQYNRRRFEATLQPYFDRIDGAFWARRVFAEPLDGAVPRRLLLQIGLGDVEVPNIGAFLHARTLGLSLLEPSPVPVFGLTGVSSPTTNSALALFDMGIDLHDAYEQAQPYVSENAVHLGARNLDGAVEQLEAFFGPADEIAQFCEGVCDPD